MSAGTFDIPKIEQGASFELDLTLTDENDAPIDLTGHVFSGQIRKTYSDAVILAAFSFVVADQSIPANLGKVKVKLSDAQTTAIPVPAAEEGSIKRPLFPYFYDIESSVPPTGTRYRWLEGIANISPEVTK